MIPNIFISTRLFVPGVTGTASHELQPIESTSAPATLVVQGLLLLHSQVNSVEEENRKLSSHPTKDSQPPSHRA